MFTLTEKREYLNGEFMTFKKRHSFIIVILFFLISSSQIFAQRLYELQDTSPSGIIISGVFHPTDNRVLHGDYEAMLHFFNEDNSIPTVSTKYNITVHKNYYRFLINLKSVLVPMFLKRQPIYLRMVIDNQVDVTLPFASVPKSIKSGIATTTNRMMDDNVFSIDYINKRIGIGTSVPSSTVHVVGTVNASQYLIAEGSGLTNLKHGGGDNYNSLRSENGQFNIITVNATGQMMIGGRQGIDVPSADLQVYGSLLVEPNSSLTSNIVSGAGSRWMWYSDRSVLRIGYTPSIYWDDQFSGDHSIAFGYATQASGLYSIVTGGYYNRITTSNSVITGGSDNKILSPKSIILGGQKNEVLTDESAVILGGFHNNANNNSIILGGYDNFSNGNFSVVAGFENSLSGDYSVILGGKNNKGYSKESILIGSNIYSATNNIQSVLFGASDTKTESITSSHIVVNAPNGFSIGTDITTQNGVLVNGAISGRLLYGDATKLVNVKNQNSAWTLQGGQPQFLSYPNHLGVGTSNLLEALNVNGSINLFGVAQNIPGTIRFLDDVFSVYKEGKGWLTLQMVDTDTTYNVDQSLALYPTPNTFYVSTKNAIVGQVKRWNTSYWEPNYMDQFNEEPEASRASNVSLPKRLFLATGNVAVNIKNSQSNSDILAYPFAVMTDQNKTTGAYLYAGNGDNEKSMSISVDPPGVHFQGYYEGDSFRQSSVDGGGFYLGNYGLTFYVDDSTGVKRDVLMLSTNNIDILSTEPAGTNYPFYLGGDLSTKSFVFRTDQHGVGIYRRSPLLSKSVDQAVVFNQKNNGELFIQSADQSGDIIFQQSKLQSARLQLSPKGTTLFGLTNRYIRSAFDVADGHIHVSDGFGIEFFERSTTKSGLIIDSTNPKRIQLFTSANFSTPNMLIYNTGNVAINGFSDNSHDLIINQVNGQDTILQLDTISSKSPGILFYVDGIGSNSANNNYTDNGEFYGLQMNNNNLTLTEDNTKTSAITITPTGFVGLFDAAPTAALSVKSDVVLINQKGVYFKEVNGNASPAIILNGNKVDIKSSDEIQVLDANDNISFLVGSNGVAMNRSKLFSSIDGQAINFEISGNTMVNGDIYNVLNDKIFPLNVKNNYNTKSERTINTIKIDTASGLTLIGNNTNSKLTVKATPYYNRIKTPRGLLSATKNMELRLIGKGITISANNQAGRGDTNFNDTLKLINDIISGGVISGNLKVKGNFISTGKIRGNAFGLRNIPFRWQHVTRNNSTIADPPNIQSFYADDGEIYYTSGNVGIGTTDPQTLFEVVGKAQIDSLLVTTNLVASDIKSTADISITSKGALLFRSNNDNIVFGRNLGSVNSAGGFKEFMRFTKDSQWLMGVDTSPYLVDLGRSSPNDLTEFRVESDQHSFIDFTRTGSAVSASIRYDDSGSRYLTTLSRKNIQIETSNGFGFFTNTATKSVTIDDQAHVGIFSTSPKNSLDINGNVAIGYDQVAPSNGMIIEKNVGVGMAAAHLPLYALEVSGSAVVGEPLSSPLATGFFINGDGQYKLLIGGHSISDELVMASPNISIKNGWLMIEQGIDPGMQIIRDNTTAKIDKLYQLESGKGYSFTAQKDISLQTYDGTNWANELVIDSAGKMGVGTIPSEVLHVKDDDSDVIVKIKSASNSLVHMKKGAQMIVFGSDSKGFHLNTHAANLTNSDITIQNNYVAINTDEVKQDFALHVNGTINGTDYMIQDKFHSSGYRSFQTVPTGIVVLWLEETIPEGWEECDGTNGCPKMDDKYVKGVGTGTNIGDTGGSNSGITTATTHTHNNTTHDHKLTSGSHSHEQKFNSDSNHRWSHHNDGYSHLRNVGHNEYTLLNTTGSHRHYNRINHDHNALTFSYGDHTNSHGDSPDETHLHGENADENDTKTVGSGKNKSGDNGDEHKHTFDSRPKSRIVKFIVKVNQS